MEELTVTEKTPDDKIHVSILGSCVPRDTIAFSQKAEKFVVDRFAQFVNPLTVIDKSPLLKPLGNFIYEAKAVMKDGSSLNHFRRRNIELDLNKDVIKYVTELYSKWLILDLGCLRLNITRFENGSYTNAPYMEQIIPEMIKQGFISDKGIIVSPDKFSDDELIEKIDCYIAKILNYYPQNNVIYFEIKPTEYCVTSDGYITIFKYGEKYNSLYKLNRYIVNKYKEMHIIEFPLNQLGDERHRWGKGELHFTKECYDYAYAALEKICGGGTPRLKKRKPI